MKKTFIMIVMLTGIFTGTDHCVAQFPDTALQTTHAKIDKNTLMQKSKKQKTAAKWLLIAGAGVSIAGVAIIWDDAARDAAGALATGLTLGFVTPEDRKDRASGPILAIAGAGSMLGSIPLFKASGKNAWKASLVFSPKRAPSHLYGQIELRRVPSLQLTIPVN